MKKSVKKKPVKRKTVKKAKKAVKKTKKKVTKKLPKAKKVVKKVKKRPVAKKTTKKKSVKKAPKKAVKKTSKKKSIKKVPKKAKKSTKKVVKKISKSKPAKAEPTQKKSVKITYPALPWTDSERIKLLTKILREFVRKKLISDWRINFSHTKSANLYAGNQFKVENELIAHSEDLFVTIHKRFDKTIGEAQLPIIGKNEKEIRQQLIQAATVCEHARKPTYDLPLSEEVTFPKSYDASVLEAFQEGKGSTIPRKTYKRIKTILGKKDVKTNAHEILTSASAVRVLNSNGVDVSFYRTSIYVEVTLSHKVGGEEQEFHWYTYVVSPEQLNLRIQLERQVEIVQDAARAEFNPGFTGDVLLSGRSLLDFFAPTDNVNPLILHTFAKLTLMGLTQLKHNEPLGEFTGEPFTITSNPQLPLGSMSTPVDDEGTALEPVDIIRTGVFTNHIATARYAHQLKIPRTGMVTNIHIADGATREEHLRGHNYFEIVSFSWFNPDPFSGDFSAEVRLGYHWLRGKKQPFRGGMFTGNVFANLLGTRFSKEVMQAGHYYGPRAVLFKDGKVTKRE